MPDLPNRGEAEQNTQAAVLGVLLLMQADWLAAPGGRLNWATYERAVRDAVYPRLVDTYRRAAATMAQAEQQAAPTLYGEGASEWATRRAGEIARDVIRTTKDRLGGLGGEFTTEDLESIFGKKRAERVAVTETSTATTAGEKGAAEEMKAGGPTGKEPPVFVTPVWYTEKDAMVCSICAPMHGKPEKDWPEALRDGPPAHPNCRCHLTWEQAEDPTNTKKKES